MKKIKIGVTDCSKYTNYAKWIASEPNIEAVQLGYSQNNFSQIENCDGILLTGGEDVHPIFYNKPELLEFCYQDDVDERRDEFEWRVLDYSQKKQLPLLGICRGLQIANVFFGGSLIPDIPIFKKTDHSKLEGTDRYHEVVTAPNSLLQNLTHSDKGEVNSAHHQSADRIGEGLIVNASSSEGIIEGLEWAHPKGKSFMLLVQWHPERMINQENVFTKNIKNGFINSIIQ